MRSKHSRRVVITGIGVVSPVGSGVEPFWKNVVAGVSVAARSTVLAQAKCPWQVAAEVHDFQPDQWLGRKDARRMDRLAQFGLVASLMAVADAKLDFTKENPERCGVSVGTAQAGMLFGAKEYDAYKEKGVSAVSPGA